MINKVLGGSLGSIVPCNTQQQVILNQQLLSQAGQSWMNQQQQMWSQAGRSLLSQQSAYNYIISDLPYSEGYFIEKESPKIDYKKYFIYFLLFTPVLSLLTLWWL